MMFFKLWHARRAERVKEHEAHETMVSAFTKIQDEQGERAELMEAELGAICGGTLPVYIGFNRRQGER